MKRILSFMLAFVLLFSVCSVISLPTAAADSTSANNTKRDLWMKIGVEYASIKEKRVACDSQAPTAAPYEDGDHVFVPLRAIATYLEGSMTVSGNTVTVSPASGTAKKLTATSKNDGTDTVVAKDGVFYIELNHAATTFGLKVYYSSVMEMIGLSETSSLIYPNNYATYQTMAALARVFVFDNPTSDKLIADLKAAAGKSHPRLIATQDEFDELRALYEKNSATLTKEEKTVQGWLISYVLTADGLMKDFVLNSSTGKYEFKDEDTRKSFRAPYYCYDENGKPILPDVSTADNTFQRHGIPAAYNDKIYRFYTYDAKTQTATYTRCDDNGTVIYTDSASQGDGYDEGGRLNESVRQTEKLLSLAFAYQMTGDKKYSEAIYLIMVELGKWPSWGESHFLNCADSAARASLAFDWAFNGWTTEQQDELATIIYEKCVEPGYWCSTSPDRKTAAAEGHHVRIYSGSGGWDFIYRVSNWNPVCTSGVSLACMAVMDRRSMEDHASVAMATVLKSVQVSFIEHVPDGSYMESPGYWAYATNALFELNAAMLTALGDDYGMMDMIGLKTTCYYAANISNNKGIIWAYHDCAQNSQIDSEDFYFAASYYGDTNIAALRTPTGSFFDIFFYQPGYLTATVSPALDYFMTGAETVSMRQNWTDQDAIWCGLHVGPNVSDHSDMDSGTFILEAGGQRWFSDIGSENYNIGGYFGTTRYLYYRKSLEAHNSIMILSDKADVKTNGQVYNTYNDKYAVISRFDTNDYGAVTVADMTPQYGSDCISAKRALMLTASRNAVVLQDEMTFGSITTFMSLFTNNNGWTCEISTDGRTAYLTKGSKTLRLSILSSNRKLTFDYIKAGEEPILSNTIALNSKSNKNPDGSYIYPRATATGGKLYIRGENLKTYQYAVVMQLVTTKNEQVAYTLTDINNMMPEDGKKYGIGNDTPDKPEYKYKASELLREVKYLPRIEDLDSYTLGDLYEMFVKVYAIRVQTDPDSSGYSNASYEFKLYMRDAADYIDRINEAVEKANRVYNRVSLIPLRAI